MNKLFTFGCSMTVGSALYDVWDFEKNENLSPERTSKYAWPQILADKMKLTCINLAKGGASNKEIYHTALTTPDITSGDTVIVQWTYPERWCIIKDDHIDQIGPWIETPSAVAYYTHIHTNTDSYIENEMRRAHVDLHFKNLGIKVYHLKLTKEFWNDVDHLKLTKEWPSSSITYLKPHILDIQDDYKTSANDKNLASGRRGHPCAKAHYYQADIIHQEIAQ